MICCGDKTLQVVLQENVAIDSNFYNCISFVTLRQELHLVGQSIEIANELLCRKNFNEVYLSRGELKKYRISLKNQSNEI